MRTRRVIASMVNPETTSLVLASAVVAGFILLCWMLPAPV